ncbi:nuclear transport factor 2 family protein [Limnoglobus roseus]|uniref:Nuclear transport factor 2 family protein n=1 Tax=Limnoglobus roseus TaxID=2598579 RepID=A0A5C1A8Y7_9BACT|nr:nuclear transport factor 2 family protein [Limnoglobus roseus]QEL14995.1 nuclear transport factor 2 family protein [Limnoglobus roseus]
MSDLPTPNRDLLRAAYAAFNARNIDAALATMAPDVAWPKAFKGGAARGHDEVRAYWTEQWSEIDPHVEPTAFDPEAGDQVLVHVHQVVRDLTGAVIADGYVGHRFTIEAGWIRAMEVCPLPPPDSGA